MPSSIIIREIQIQAHCGVTEIERSQPQPILVDLSVQCANEAAFQSDDLSDTLDYGTMVDYIRDNGERQQFSLLEKLTEELCQGLFRHFPLSHINIWVRKIRAPIKNFSGSVGIRLSRSRQDFLQAKNGHPSRFLMAQLPRLPRGKALDVATGRGRHAHFLATNGFQVHGIDRDQEALDFVQAQAKKDGGLPITTECIDLERNDLNPPDFGTESYHVIMIFFYLYRPLFPQLIKAMKPGGIILCETFLLENHLQRNHPRRKEFCLEANELLTLLPGFQILHYDEGDHQQRSSQSERAFTARILARKPISL